MYFPFITGKNFLFRALVEIAAAGWFVLLFADKAYRPRFSWTLVWYKALVVWMVVANLMAVNPHKAFWSNYERMDGWVTLGHLYILLLVMAAVLSTEKLWHKWWLTFIAGNALVSLYGIGQLLGMAQIHQGSTRIDATIGNAEYFAGYLLFAIAVTLWQAFETRAKNQAWLRYSLFVLAAVQFVLLFMTGTRGTLIGLIVGALAGSALWIYEAGKQGRKVAVGVFAALILLVGGLFVVRDSSFVKNDPNLQRLASVFSLKEALGPRITIWHMAVEGITEKPVTGWGQEGFNYVFNKYYEPSMYAQEPWFDRAHNMFLDWAIAGGIPALFFFVAVLISAALALYRSKVSRYERILFLSALVGYVVQGLVVFDNLFTYIPFVAILAMAHMASSKPIKQIEKWGTINDTRLDTLIGPVAIVLGVLVLWFVNMPSVLASGDLIDGLTPSNSPAQRLESFKAAVNEHGLAHQEITEQVVSFAAQAGNDGSITLDTRQSIVSYAGDQMNAELAIAPKDTRLHLQYALFFRSIGDIPDAQKESATARSLSPNKQTVIIEQGVEAFQAKQYTAAKEFFTQAYELDKTYKDAAGNIAAADVGAGDIAGAKALLVQEFGTTSVNNSMLMLAYYQANDWKDLIDVVRAKVAVNQDATSMFQLAAAYSQAGQRDAAIATVRTAIQQHPEAAAQGASLLQQLGANP